VGADWPVDSLVARGRAELDRVEQRMRAIAQRTFNSSDPDVVLTQLPPVSDTAAIDSAVRATLERAAGVVPRWFGSQPNVPVVIRPLPSAGSGSPAAMYLSARREGDSATIMLNYGALRLISAAALEPLLYHEGTPGHHLMLVRVWRRGPLHPVFSFAPIGAFSEGWAMYAEGLADEMGLVRSDTVRLALLNSERQRAARMVADAGVHVFGWDQTRTRDFLTAHGMSSSQAASEYQRYKGLPGQGATYTLGLLAIREVRDRLQRRQGVAFDIRQFHDRILRFGLVPTAALWAEFEPDPR
jgi:uncharacterized protein (DUF885 family)